MTDIQTLKSTNKRLYSFYDTYFQQFEHWTYTINLWLETIHIDKNINEEESKARLLDAARSISEMLIAFARYGQFKETWKEPMLSLNVFGFAVVMDSEKTNTRMRLVVDYEGITLETYLGNEENIQYMKDDFWQNILDLSNHGTFKFQDNSVPLSYDKSPVTKSQNSTVFRIIRNYILMAQDGEVQDFNLGYLELNFDFEHPVEQIFVECCQAFKLMYKINYSLWKVSDLKRKKGTH